MAAGRGTHPVDKKLKGSRFVDSAVFKVLAVFSFLRGMAALYGLYALIGELIGLLTADRLLGDIFSYGFGLAMQLVRIYILALHALLGAGALLLLFKRRRGARLCRIGYMHLKIGWALFAFGINYIRINEIFTVEYLLRTVLIDVCFVLLVLYSANLKRAMDDISYELLGYNAQYASTRALTGQAMALGVAALIDYAWNGYLYILLNLVGECFDAPLMGRFIVYSFYAVVLIFFGVSFGNTALRMHIRAKYLSVEANQSYTPAFQPLTAILGAFAAGLYALCYLDALFSVIYDRIYFGVRFHLEMVLLRIPYALGALAYTLFALALAGVRRNLLTAIGAAAQIIGLSFYLFGGGYLPYIGIDTLDSAASLVWWALLLLAAVSAMALDRLPQARSFPAWLRLCACLLAALLFVPTFVNAYIPQLKGTAYPILYSFMAASDLTARVMLMLHVGTGRKNALPVKQI